MSWNELFHSVPDAEAANIKHYAWAVKTVILTFNSHSIKLLRRLSGLCHGKISSTLADSHHGSRPSLDFS